MRLRDSARQLDALARALRRISRKTTRLRRPVALDAQRLVDLEGATDEVVRSPKRLQQQTQEPR
jgi:hypothetical protein